MREQALDDALAAAASALGEGDPVVARARLSPFEPLATTDRQVARSWLELLRQTPGERLASGELEVVARSKRILTAFPNDAELVAIGCDALIREAERLPPDQPPPPAGAAHTAVAIVQRCLESLAQPDRDDSERLGYLQIGLANALRLAHLYDRAGAAYRAALKRGPEHGWWWFNYGLLLKAQGDFKEGLAVNDKALAKLGPERPVLWNIAICATALGEGKRAMEAYQRLGIPCIVNDAGMPQTRDLPAAQVRVASVGPGHAGPTTVPDRAVSFELVWVSPLSPCHGVVQTPTYRQASIDYGDVVLWDAIPVSMGRSGGRQVPRFPLLTRLRQGDEYRFRFIALQRRRGAIEALEGPSLEGGQLFVHRPPEGTEELLYGKLVLPASTDLATFRQAFTERIQSIAGLELVVPEMLEALGDTAAAGKAHTMWRGLERTIEKRRDD
ncbi:MAG: tetratricopeptide repeat protein [Myxococcales bacterium]|nr:tetratricopeptide repeat protein [Myxococcales bacterium]